MRPTVLVWLLALVALLLGAQAALGCSCAPPSTSDAREDVADADAAIFGEVLEVRDEGRTVTYRIRVVERFKGDVGAEIEVVSVRSTGDPPLPGCSLELGVGEQTGLLLARGERGWSSSSCGERTREHLRAGVRAPKRRSKGPVRVVVAGAFGPARVAALDARGRLVRLGAGEGDAAELAPCPGGRRVLEAVHRPGAGWSLEVRDVATMKVRRAVALDLRPERYDEQPTSLSCDAADGSRARMGVIGDHGRARVVTITGETLATPWRATTQSWSARLLLGRRYGWVVTGERLLRIDPRTGAAVDLGARPAGERVLAVSPDERRLVVLSGDYAADVALLDARTGGVIAALSARETSAAHWLDPANLVLKVGEGLRFGDTQLRQRAMVPDTRGVLPALAAAGRLWVVEGAALRTYDRSGRAVGPRRRLFTAAVHVLAVLPKPVRARARASAARACAWRGVRPPAIA